MTVEIASAWLIAILLLSLRFGVLLYLMPIISSAKVPGQVIILWNLALAIGVLAVVEPPLLLITDISSLTKSMFSELILGALLVFGVLIAFAGFLLGGRIVDFQMGFGVAGLIDPATQSQSPLIGTVLHLIAIMVFFTLDGHHLLLRGLVFSVEKIPPGTWLGDLPLAIIVAHFGTMFSFAIAIVAPIIFSILLIDVGLAVMARTMPQMNVFIVSLPLKIFTGLSIAALSLHSMVPLMESIFETIFVFWQDVILS